MMKNKSQSSSTVFFLIFAIIVMIIQSAFLIFREGNGWQDIQFTNKSKISFIRLVGQFGCVILFMTKPNYEQVKSEFLPRRWSNRSVTANEIWSTVRFCVINGAFVLGPSLYFRLEVNYYQIGVMGDIPAHVIKQP